MGSRSSFTRAATALLPAIPILPSDGRTGGPKNSFFLGALRIDRLCESNHNDGTLEGVRSLTRFFSQNLPQSGSSALQAGSTEGTHALRKAMIAGPKPIPSPLSLRV